MARLTCSFSGGKYKPTIQNNQTLAICIRGIHSVLPLQSTISSIFFSGYRAVVVSGIKPESLLYDCFSFQVQAQTNTSVYLLNPTLASWSDWAKLQEGHLSVLGCFSCPFMFSSAMR